MSGSLSWKPTRPTRAVIVMQELSHTIVIAAELYAVTLELLAH